MRRIFIAVLCLLLLTTAVSAAGTVSSLQNNTTIDDDGTCQISLTLQLTVESADSDLRFPLPGNCKDIVLNGERADTTWDETVRWVDLSKAIGGAGTHSLTLRYALPDLVTEEKSGLLLTLPLLSGFAYPIENVEFSITLPGATKEKPAFSSTYLSESVETIMEYTVKDTVISGKIMQGLNDHETLTMTLPVTAEMFPQTMAKRWSLSNDDMIQYALTILAAIYWLIFLRCKLPRRLRSVQAPDGITAGELGCHLAGQGVDFSAMVLSWAQMGYLTIEVKRSGRVLLHKGMDMGNERSEFEVRSFRALFGKRETVDGGGEHVARLGRKVSKTVPGAWHYFKKSSGNPLIFRCIAAAIGAVAGSSLAAGFVTDTAWVVVLSIFLVPLGAASSWLIQTGVRGVQLRHRFDLMIAAGCSALWLLLGIAAGEWNVAIYVIVSQILAGFAAACGSRRTEAGLQVRGEILGLRKYLKTLSSADVHRIMEHNPDYYFAMAPYAIALGVEKAFARQFRDAEQSFCPYLAVEGQKIKTAQQWNEQMHRVLNVLDMRQRKLPFERFLGK